MIIQGNPGEQTSADGALATARIGRNGDLMVSELHGRYYEQARRGHMFGVANQAVVTTTAGLATTFTGLAVANPAGSGFNLVLDLFMCTQTAVAVAGSIGLMTGAGAAAGSLTPRNALVGGGASVATASAGATIATPVLERVFAQVGSLATTGYGLTPGLVVDLGGSLIIPPGFFVASYTTAATTSALVFGLVWEEVAI